MERLTPYSLAKLLIYFHYYLGGPKSNFFFNWCFALTLLSLWSVCKHMSRHTNAHDHVHDETETIRLVLKSALRTKWIRIDKDWLFGLQGVPDQTRSGLPGVHCTYIHVYNLYTFISDTRLGKTIGYFWEASREMVKTKERSK